MNNLPAGQVTLERALSKLGITSRSIGRKWILAGIVRVDGVLRKDPLFPCVPEKALIEIDGEQMEAAKTRTYLLYKPRGVVTTRNDEKGRPTVFSLLTDVKEHLIAVGRLDLASSGVLILTNDTHLADWLTSPKNEVRRTYLVTVRGRVTDDELELLAKGITDKEEFLQATGISIRKASGKETHLTVQLQEGKNREIRRLFAAIKHEVTTLKRVSYGNLELGSLQPGQYRELTRAEIERLSPPKPARDKDLDVK